METMVNTDGEPITKKGNIKLDRTSYDNMGKAIPHELWSDHKRSVQIATNARRPWGGVCKDRLCATHVAPFKVKKNGYEITIKGKTKRGDLYECPVGHEQYVEGLG